MNVPPRHPSRCHRRYGQCQSWTPQLVLGPLQQSPPSKWVAALWSGVLAVLPLTLGIVMLAGGVCLGLLLGAVPVAVLCAMTCRPSPRCARSTEPAGLCCNAMMLSLRATCCRLDADTFGPGVPAAPAVVAITVCLYAFCIAFAINSAIHSYLIVAYAEGDKVRLLPCLLLCYRGPSRCLASHLIPLAKLAMRPAWPRAAAGCSNSGRLLRVQRGGAAGGHPGFGCTVQLRGQQHCGRLWSLPDGLRGLCRCILCH